MIMCLAISIIPIAMISGLQGFQIASAFLVLILVITLLVGYVISYFIARPLVTLTKNIDDISKGNLDVELEKSEIYEINNLMASLDRVMASLKLAIHKVGLKKEEIFEEVIKAKEEAEKKFENVLRKIDGWIREINEKGVCTICSAKVSQTLGYDPEQMIGKEIFNYLPEKEAEKLKEALSTMPKEKTEGAKKIDLYWSYSSDKHPVWIRSYLIPVFDSSGHFLGLRCFSRDNSEIRVAQDQAKELQKKIEFLETQIHNIGEKYPNDDHVRLPVFDPMLGQDFDYMLLFDENAKIMDCTNDIQSKLGYNKREMLTLTLSDVSCLESHEAIKANLIEAKKHGTMRIKTIHKKKDGSSVLVSEQIKYLKDRNMFICMVKEDLL